MDIELDIPQNEIFIFHEQSFDIPIVGMLFKIEGISSISVSSKRLTISKLDSFSWSVIKPLVLATINDYKHHIQQNDRAENIYKAINEYVNDSLNNIYVEYVNHYDKTIFVRITERSSSCNTCTTSACNECPSNAESAKSENPIVSNIENVLRFALNDPNINVKQSL